MNQLDLFDNYIGKFYNENRTPVEYDDVNPTFWEALIDTEDERYYKHWGIDPLGLVGAAKDAITGRGGRGASTITQQLAKNMFRVRTQYSTGIMGKIPGLAILIMKTKEWITATKLEIYFSVTMGREAGKKEILRQYANTVDFGHNAYGIKTAANTTPIIIPLITLVFNFVFSLLNKNEGQKALLSS